MNYGNIIAGAVGGLVYSLTGWLKHAKEDGFDAKKLGLATSLGLIWGLIAGFMNMEIGLVVTGGIGTTVTALIQNLWKAIFKD